jgi:small subunit ribosomal protein S20
LVVAVLWLLAAPGQVPVPFVRICPYASRKYRGPPVANIASQIKRNRQNEKRRLRNKSVRAELRTRTKNAVTAAQVGAEDSIEQLRLAVKRIDKAAARGVIHKNTAANHKSRLVRRVAAIEAANAPVEVEVDDEVDE